MGYPRSRRHPRFNKCEGVVLIEEVMESPAEIMNRLIPGGSQTASKSPSRFVQATPKVAYRGQGALLIAGDKPYLDFGMALGACILGYNNPAVQNAVMVAVSDGPLFSLPSYKEAVVAELLLSHVPWAEQVRFGKTGTDVTTAAVRVARAATGRSMVFHSGYHGWADWSMTKGPAYGVLPQGTAPFSLTDLVPVYGELEHFAAVVVEVAQGAIINDIPLAELRRACDATGTVLIFDEVLSGFRYKMGSASEVIPDLACFGKAIGNGYSISALVGKRELMNELEPGGVFFSGTSFGETIGLAACEATLGVMADYPVHQHLSELGQALKEGANEVMGWPEKWQGDGARTTLKPGMPDIERDVLQQECAKAGLLFIGAHNICWEHSVRHLDKAVDAYGEAWRLIRRTEDVASLLEGPPTIVPYRMQ